MSAARDPRGGRAWQALSQSIYDRDGRECRQCGHTGSTDNPLQIDHVLPWSEYPELGLDPDNLQVLCRKHNLLKSNKTESKRINWYDKGWLSSIA